MKNKIAALILTKNEELHINRCIKSISSLVSEIYVVDSGSQDNTKNICEKYNVKFFFNEFVTHSKQFNYGLNLVKKDKFKWVLKIDADEIFTPKLLKEIDATINDHKEQFSGLAIKRKIIFHGKVLNFGGVTTNQIRVFKTNEGFCENVFMDEHIKVKGIIKNLKEPFYDYCLKNITWWIRKHNLYANKEVLNILFLNNDKKKSKEIRLSYENQKTRFLKVNLYQKSPILLRSFLFFLFKYFFLLGFLDGTQGLIYNFLQSFWYRFLIDVKILELKNFSKKHNISLQESIEPVLGIDFKKYLSYEKSKS